MWLLSLGLVLALNNETYDHSIRKFPSPKATLRIEPSVGPLAETSPMLGSSGYTRPNTVAEDSSRAATTTVASLDAIQNAGEPTGERSTTASAEVPMITPTFESDLCWSFEPCLAAISDLAESYKEAKNMTDPNEHSLDNKPDYSRYFQSRFCTERQYKNILLPDLSLSTSPFQICFTCFEQAGVDITSPTTPAIDIIYKIYDFCHSDWPNTYDLLAHYVSFMEALEAPKSFAIIPAYVTGVVSQLSSKFIWQDGMNRNTLARTTTQNWWDTPLSGHNPIPTEYLSQLPAKWPYTAYGLPHHTASWPLTHPKTSSKTVAWVFHSMLFLPRPLHTPKSHTLVGGMYQPLLDDWTRGFLYTTTMYTPTPTTASATKDGTPGEPTVTQMEVLPKEADIDAEIRASMRSRSEAEKRTSVGVAAMGLRSGTETETEGVGARESRAGELLEELKSILATMGVR
ncbi:hypothetical protein BDU57DRAFT_593908 [Ampelomyces quisqualis]|uniref:Uncharacterized protein n=1 Tax=Ampelomyces quisqualis TaxID=50730 RepID=A0A6A5QQ65_AMPQU|nr:hypothetical protein BDU57DRAFT_593908 [Ampelomyces quisqualis]